MFNEIDFSLFTSDTVEFYLEVFDGLIPSYYDAYEDHKKRSFIESIFDKLEKRILLIKQERTQKELTKCLIMSPTRCFAGDWSKYNTKYSYNDKMYINKKISKYGYLHLKEMMHSMYRLQYKELFPELLLSLEACLNKYIEINGLTSILNVYNDISYYLKLYSCYNFLNNEKNIKSDKELTDAFEKILEFQIKFGNETAAVILDEFRIH